MDNLEKFIRDKREEFDSELPREELWKKIESSIDSPTNTSLNWGSWMWKAAAVFLLFSTTWLLMDKWQQPSVQADYEEDAFTEEFRTAETILLNTDWDNAIKVGGLPIQQSAKYSIHAGS